MSADYRLFVNDERTVLVRIWTDDKVEVALRLAPDRIWSPPVTVKEDKSG